MNASRQSPRRRKSVQALAAGALAAAGLLASCAPTSSTYSYVSGRTNYLWETDPGTGAPSAQPFVPRVDTVSYWNGDGVEGSPKVVIKLGEQKALFYRGDRLVGVSAVSTGDAEHPTPTGTFRISQKSPDHESSLYGSFVDDYGATVMDNVDSRVDKAPSGTRFEGASMPHFMRFNKGIGMHAGYLPGYPASHGCVRMPPYMAQKFFENVEIGTPVEVVR